MKVLISTFGVRGDVQPYLALAVGLQAALGQKMRAEDGVARAVEVIERHVATRTHERARNLDHERAKGREGAKHEDTKQEDMKH